MPEVSAYMVSLGRVDVETAMDYLKSHSILANNIQQAFYKHKTVLPSTLFVELELSDVTVTLNIVFQTIGLHPVNLFIRKNSEIPIPSIQKELMGTKEAEWYETTFRLLEKIRVSTRAPPRANLVLQLQMKLLSTLLNIMITNLDLKKEYHKDVERFLKKILSAELNPLFMVTPEMPSVLRVGFPLILALYQMFKHQVEQCVGLQSLASALKEEQLRVFNALAKSGRAMQRAESLEEFLYFHTKKFQVTLYLLAECQVNHYSISALF